MNFEPLEGMNFSYYIQTAYKLPDGSTLEIGPARFRAAEVLFRPDIIGEEWPGIANALDMSIRVCFDSCNSPE